LGSDDIKIVGPPSTLAQRNRSRNSKENSEVNLVEINGSEILGSSLAKETHHNKRKHAEGVKSFISKILDSFH